MARLPDPFAIPLISDALRQSPVVIADCGAAGGIDPLFSQLSDRNVAKCYGFEPNPAEHAKFKPRENTTYFPFAISNKVGPAEFYASKTFGALQDRSAVIDADFQRVTVQVESIDNLVDTGRIAPPNVIKTDIEGHDYFALLGAERSLGSVLCVKSEIGWSDPDGFSAIHAYLIGRGFLPFGVSYNVSVFGPLQSGDALYLRSVDHLLSQAGARGLLVKLLAIAAVLRFFEYAALCVRKAADKSVLSASERDALLPVFTSAVYLPEHVPVSGIGTRIAVALSAIAELCAGHLHRAKSLPKSNRFLRPGFLFRASRRGRGNLAGQIEQAATRPDAQL